ncbi:FUSC family protein [Komagataeibacter oboediens]|uniref:FUSC family protein n=1 Tax=Komagataeibacter oboediens TaxID=65958 RepID=UPI001C2BD110|nr:FUSC family protein [Komagataeibacter oboediens]MBV0886933.1 FUSC family protein [Komagataeibacter oboediens]MBV1823055.1 FUSC family protein [Komagataeibacter oboediens]MCK9821796.1 FUSC family protein [Komagataeibacter oboediens]
MGARTATLPLTERITTVLLHPVRRVSWIYAPTLPDLAFAVRTSFAAIISLLIAMWMELDSPQWAPLTVWVVAQSSRGESLSKARWRIFGTLVGGVAAITLMAAFPQAPALFFTCLSLWIGLCCALATLLDQYRAYGLVLTGFTSAIIATGAITQPDDVFAISVARTSYIILGVLCEAVLAVVFMPRMVEHARQQLLDRLAETFRATCANIIQQICAPAGPEQQAITGSLLKQIVTFSGQIEFSALELGPRNHVGDHARRALAGMLVMLAQARALQILHPRMTAPPRMDDTPPERALATWLQQNTPDPATDTVDSPEWQPVTTALVSEAARVRSEMTACATAPRGDRFRFSLTSRRHMHEAVNNGIRAAAAIMGACMVWEITAWHHGPAFISFVALIYGLMATRENPLVATTPFLKGGLWCAAVASVLALWIIPAITAPEILLAALLVPMTIGGLAARRPHLAGYAFSFNMFLPVLIGPINQGRFDEVSFFNNTMAFLASIIFVLLTYRLVVPFRMDVHIRRTEAWVSQRLRHLGRIGTRTDATTWLAACAASLVRILFQASALPPPVLGACMARQIMSMTVGIYVIRLRELVRGGHLSPRAGRIVGLFLARWDRGQAAAMTPYVLAWTRHEQARVTTPQARQQMAEVLACLRIITTGLRENPDIMTQKVTKYVVSDMS